MAAKRQLLIQPYHPDYTENLGDNTGQYSDSDIGKAVKYSGDAMVLCATGDEIVGFVMSVEVGTKDGFSIGGVRKEGRAWALDEAGTLTVGTVVVAGAAGTLGTLANNNVLAAATAGTSVTHAWVVISIVGTGAGRTVLVEKV